MRALFSVVMAGPAAGRVPAIPLRNALCVTKQDARDGAPRALARGDPDKPAHDEGEGVGSRP